jgi:hypothetical protein
MIDSEFDTDDLITKLNQQTKYKSCFSNSKHFSFIGKYLILVQSLFH